MTEYKSTNGFVAALPGAMLILAVAIICFAGAPVLNSIYFFNKYLPLADFILAILLGILWLLLAGRTARVERGEAEMLLIEELGKPKGGER